MHSQILLISLDNFSSAKDTFLNVLCGIFKTIFAISQTCSMSLNIFGSLMQMFLHRLL